PTELDDVPNRGALARPRLAAEPAPLRHVPLEDPGELLAALRSHELEPALLDLEGAHGTHATLRHPRSLEPKPDEAVRRERQAIRMIADRGEPHEPPHLHRDEPLEAREVDLHPLVESREVRHHEHALLLMLAQEGEHLRVLRVEELEGAVPE